MSEYNFLNCGYLHLLNRRDRVTIQEKEREELRQRELELEKKKSVEERRKQTLKVTCLVISSSPCPIHKP